MIPKPDGYLYRAASEHPCLSDDGESLLARTTSAADVRAVRQLSTTPAPETHARSSSPDGPDTAPAGPGWSTDDA
ncbi:hypothetical protein PUR61_08565 [Streptomyces sp. BE20]|uniref:hypothetical protein n=1 Tax=Streptomyces sp. BE20 TaxID=3002525 RepID=UPI002E7A8B79|nr:hypothetical protein [Streptomyces sp. BE20]MEE1822245.1 hypothetical protein [Streptomyces sp. BE20]